MGLFAKLKAKKEAGKERKRRKKEFSKFISGQRWLYGCSSYAWGLFSPMEENPDSWTMEGLVKTITDWDFHKEIKSAEEQGENPGDGYGKVFSDWSNKIGGISDDSTDLPGGSTFFANDQWLYDESWDEFLTLFATVLKLDSDYWYGKDYDGERSAYPYLDLFEATQGESNRILLASLALDPYGTFNGTAHYARLLKAILKAYSAHKGGMWDSTMRSLFYGERDHELTLNGDGKVSLLAAVYNYTNELDESKRRYIPATDSDAYSRGPIYDVYNDIKKSDSNLDANFEVKYHSSTKTWFQVKCVTSCLKIPYNRFIASNVGRVVDAAIDKVLLNDEYWGHPGKAEAWDYVNSVKEKAIVDGWNAYRRDKEESRDRALRRKKTDDED